MNAIDLSRIVITYFDDKGDPITNKKLQKLLYYIDAWSLVYKCPIINDDFEAWVHGPVIPSVYNEYKHFGYSPIKLEYKKGENASTKLKSLLSKVVKDQKKLIIAVLQQYGSLASYELEALSHSESPWKEARKGCKKFEPSSKIIDKRLMKVYYKSLLSNDKEKGEKKSTKKRD